MLKSAVRGLFLLLMVSTACKIDRDKPVDQDKFTFVMPDDAELFFRNVRQIYYNRSSPDGKWQAYRFKDFYEGNERPLIMPVIVINWLQDEAYLLVDSNEFLGEEDFLSVVINDTLQHKTDTIMLSQRGRENMLEFASRVYEGIQHQSPMFVKSKTEYLPLLNDEDDRESFRITMSDYYRLTRIY